MLRIDLKFLLVVFLILAGCSSIPTPVAEQNRLTHGAVQLHLEKGVTTQSDVITNFGSPNITTIDANGDEVWTYQKHATLSRASGAGVNVIIAGAGTSGFQRSQRTMTLIIKFNADKVVKDFQSMATNF